MSQNRTFKRLGVNLYFQVRWIRGYEGKYAVSTNGDVYSFLNLHGCINMPARKLKPYTDRFGYRRVRLSLENKTKLYMVHRLVLSTFTGEYHSGPEVQASHLNGDSSDNRFSNLVWETALENNRRRYEHGTMPLGEKTGCAKLNEEKVKKISLLGLLGFRHGDIAHEFGVDNSLISLICLNKCWKHVPRPVVISSGEATV